MSEIINYYRNAPLFPYPKSEKRGVELEIYFEGDIQKIEKQNAFYYRSHDGSMNLVSNYDIDQTSAKEDSTGEMNFVLQLTSDFDYLLNFD